MLTSSTGMAWSMSCRPACTSVTDVIVIGDAVTEAIARCSRESAWRCAAESSACVDLGQCRGQQHPLRRPRGCRPGGDVARARLDDAAEGQRVQQLLLAIRETGRPALRRSLGAVRRRRSRRRAPASCSPCRPSAGPRSPRAGWPARRPSARRGRARSAAASRWGRPPAGSPSPAARRIPRRRGGHAPDGGRRRRGDRRARRERSSQAQGTSAGSIVRIGPLNHFFAESSHHTVIARSTPMVTIGE